MAVATLVSASSSTNHFFRATGPWSSPTVRKWIAFSAAVCRAMFASKLVIALHT